jgi:hypothetical protein
MFKLPLRNHSKEIIDYTYVSEEDYDILSKIKWHKDDSGYAQGTINKKSRRLHIYIMIKILDNEINSKIKIDHIDNNRLNNLRFVTDSENNRNRKKKENCSSNYIGVNLSKIYNKWKSAITINKKTIFAYYNNEYHAAHQYNLWCEEFNLHTANLNN